MIISNLCTGYFTDEEVEYSRSWKNSHVVINLIALPRLAGCGQSGGGNEVAESNQEQRKQGLDTFYNLDDRKVQIEVRATVTTNHQRDRRQKKLINYS